MYSKIKEMKRQNNLKQKLSSTIVLISGLMIAVIYLFDLRSDYYFHVTSKKTTASVKQIKKVEEYKPYVITLSYLNQNTGKREECELKLDGRFGGKVSEGNLKDIEIYYTQQDKCDIYIEAYKVPSKGSLIIHLIIFLTAAGAIIVFAKKLFKKNSME